MLHLKSKHLLIVLLPVGIAFSALAWQKTGNNNTSNQHHAEDTIPAKKRNKTSRSDNKEPNEKDLDKEIRKLDEALDKLDGKFENIDWGKMEKEIEASVKKATEDMEHHEIDLEKVQKDIDESLKRIDFDKIQAEARAAMQQAEKNIDFKKMQADIERSIAEAKAHLNSDEFKKEIEEVKKIDMSQIKRELENARLEFEKNKVNMKEEMGKAKEEIKKAKEELKGYRQMLDEMEKEGLVNTKEDYEIEYTGAALYINHRKQPENIFNKYKDYFREDGTRIYKKNGRLNISID
jgi:chromosome segregation ATPase